MARSLDDVIADIDLPKPQPGEGLPSYAHRIATIGAHHGAAWSLTNRPPAVVYVQPQEPEDLAPGEQQTPSATVALTGSGSTDPA